MRTTTLVFLLGVSGCATLMRTPGPRTMDPWRGAVMESASLSFMGRTATLGPLPLYVRQTRPRNLLVRDSVVLKDSLPGVPRTAELVMGVDAEETYRNYAFVMRFTGRSICINNAKLFEDADGVLRGRARVTTMEDAFYAHVEVSRDAAMGRGRWRVFSDDGRLDLTFRFRDRRDGDPQPPPPLEPTDRGVDREGTLCRTIRQ